MNVAIQRMLREESKVNSWFTNYVNDLPGQFPLLIPVYKYTNVVNMVPIGTASYFDTNSGRILPLYSPRLHQIVQMAANIIEGTVTKKANGVDFFPYNPLAALRNRRRR